MEKKILIAVDDSVHCRNAVDYAVRISSAVKNLTYTLYHVQPTISQFLIDEAKTDGFKLQELKRLGERHEKTALSLLSRCRQRMMDLGVSPSHIQIATHPRRLGHAKDIIDYAQQGRYDAIVVGRRGLSKLQETLSGSITANLLENSRVVPVWIVDGEVTSSAIMLAVDGSEMSLRAVDHLGYMLSGNADITITLFHIVPKFSDFCPIASDEPVGTVEEMRIQGDRRCIDHFYAHAIQCFKKAGFKESQIRLKVAECLYHVGSAIVDEVKAGKYGTVVVGRRGGGNAFFMGSVSRTVIAKAANCALWVVS